MEGSPLDLYCVFVSHKISKRLSMKAVDLISSHSWIMIIQVIAIAMVYHLS